MRLLLHYARPRETHALDRETAPSVVLVHGRDATRVFRGRPPTHGVRNYDEVPDAAHLDSLLAPAPLDRTTPSNFPDGAVLTDAGGCRWGYSALADVWRLLDGRFAALSVRSYQRLRAEFGPLSGAPPVAPPPMRQSDAAHRPDLHPGQSVEWRSGLQDHWLEARVVRVVHERDDAGPLTTAVVQPCPGGRDLGVERTLVGPTLAICLRTRSGGDPVARDARRLLALLDDGYDRWGETSATRRAIAGLRARLGMPPLESPPRVEVPDEVTRLLDALGAPSHHLYPEAELTVAERLQYLLDRRPRPSDRRILQLRAHRAIRTMEEELAYYREHPALRSPLAYGVYIGKASAHERETLRAQIRERVALLERRIIRVRAIADPPEES